MTKPSSPICRRFADVCEEFVSNVVVALRVSPATQITHDVVWVKRTPVVAPGNSGYEVNGQIIGVGDKLVMYGHNGKYGRIFALK